MNKKMLLLIFLLQAFIFNLTNVITPRYLDSLLLEKYMFGYFANRFPQFFEHPDTFSFLDGLNDFHQLEVMKLYPEATVPHFESRVADDGNSMELIYTSPRHFSDVAVGMLNGAFDHYNETIELTMEEIGDEQEQKVIFRMKKV